MQSITKSNDELNERAELPDGNATDSDYSTDGDSLGGPADPGQQEGPEIAIEDGDEGVPADSDEDESFHGISTGESRLAGIACQVQ